MCRVLLRARTSQSHSTRTAVHVRMKFLEVRTNSSKQIHGGLVSSTELGWIATTWLSLIVR